MANKALSPMDVIQPVPAGVSWTAPPKGRPWLNPPKFVKIDEIAQGYIDNLTSSSVMNSMIDVIETNVPLASMAEALMLSGVQKGIHTIDAGILVMPVIIEMLKTMAELHSKDYIVFADDGTENNTVPMRIAKEALASLDKKTQEQPVAAPEVKLSGLMARKSKENIDGV